jgi:hypothetical protein
MEHLIYIQKFNGESGWCLNREKSLSFAWAGLYGHIWEMINPIY